MLLFRSQTAFYKLNSQVIHFSTLCTMATPSKKAKISASPSSSSLKTAVGLDVPATPEDLGKLFEEDRIEAAKSIKKVNKKRLRMLGPESVPDYVEGVVYWMSRDQRVQDNWALLFAQKLAIKNEVPLHVCFCLVSKFLDATIRHYDFLLKGLKEVEAECKKLNITFHLLQGAAVEKIPEFVKENKIGAVVTDFSPLRVPRVWVNSVQNALPKDVAFCQVDAHNIVPCWEASPKLEYGARTLRNKINNQLSDYLTKFPPVIKHPHSVKKDRQPGDVDWEAAYSSLEVSDEVPPVEWAQPGYSGALITLHSFLKKRLRTFNTDRNDPTKDSLSNLSPWFHFGQISVQRVILWVQRYKSRCSESVASYCEEAIVRRELSDNFCYYNDKYDQVAGTNAWSIKTLDDHRKDKREYLYSVEELDKSRTHDDLWNAAQLQLVKNGKMHGFLRMYWAKKILEWTESPEVALKTAIYLNDRYSLDGRDPNGYVGCMWSICGIHDQGWKEREVFGKIRFMNYQGCKRKFDVPLFVKQWGGKVHNKPKNKK